MARASLSKYFTKLQGAVDGLTFTDTPYGTVMQSTPDRRTNPQTPAQMAQRNRIRLTSRGWANLNSSQVLAWNAFAATQTHLDRSGKPFTPNGYQAYSSLTAVWYAANGTTRPPAMPPAADYAGDAISVAAAASAGTVTFTGTGPTSPNTVVEFWLQPLRNANRRPSRTGYRVKGYAALDGAGGLQFQVAVAAGVYAAAYRFVNKATGQKTPLVAIPVSGVALALQDGGSVEAEKPAARKRAA